MWYKYDANNKLILNVYVQPQAKSTEVVGLYSNSLKIKLNTPAIEGRANKALLKYISQLFKVPIRQIKIISGLQSRNKIFEITESAISPVVLLKDKT